MSDIIYEYGITLSEEERSFLTRSGWALNKQIRRIMKKYYPRGFTYYEMKGILEQAHGKDINVDTVRRGISQQTDIQSGLDELRDKYGRMPLVKSTEKRLNPESGVSISVYTWNDRYGQPLTHREIVEKYNGQQQIQLFGED